MRTLFLTFYLVSFLFGDGQERNRTRENYEICYDSLKEITDMDGSFKKAVFLTENCFLDEGMEYEHFTKHIDQLVTIVKLWQAANPILNYRYSDSGDFQKNYAIFKFLKDTIRIIGPTNRMYYLLPYTYDFTDFVRFVPQRTYSCGLISDG